MNPGRAPSCVPTWRGHVETTKDALLIFEGCFSGVLSHCFRRPHDRERSTLITSGNVFVYEEATSGIKRWTDGIAWSPSRILTNFLIYRQLNSPFPPGEKKRATKRSQRSQRPPGPYASNSRPNTSPPAADENRAIFPPDSPTESSKEESPEVDANRGLVGSLVDSYEFKENGLLKKTMTVTVNNVMHHLVSYYSLEDAKFKLKTPRDDPRLKDLPIRDALMNQHKFKFPNYDDAGDGNFDQMEPGSAPYGSYYHNGYDPARMYAQPHPGYAMPASQAYPYHAAYGPPHHHTGSTHPHLPPAPASYGPVPHAGYYAQYPAHYYHPHGQPVSHHSAPPPQSSPYATHYYQSQPAPTHSRAPNPRPEPPPRTNGTYEYEHAGHIETGNDVYGPSSVTAPPSSETPTSVAPPTHAQTWPASYSHQWAPRSENTAYNSYRPHQA